MTQQDSGGIPEVRTSPVLEREGFVHAFFTRNGGISTGPFASLSFSLAAGDEPPNVEENLRRAAKALGVTPSRLYFLSQVHGSCGVMLSGDEDRREVVEREGDALAGASVGSAVCVRIADCVPILVGDRRRGTALAVHAGWKGLVAGVIGAGIAMLERAGSSPADLVAAIGPHIGPTAFEVSDDVAAQLAACSPDADVVARVPGKKPHVDLARVTRAQLVGAGLTSDAIDTVPGCTLSEPESFFSFRRDGARSGRHLAGIAPRAPTP
jgi:YfiH family protein